MKNGILIVFLAFGLLYISMWHVRERSRPIEQSSIDVNKFPLTMRGIRLLARSNDDNDDDDKSDVVRRTALTMPLPTTLDWRRLTSRKVVMTLVTNEAYLLAACVLASTLRRVQTRFPIVAVVTAALESDAALAKLTAAGFDYLLVVDVITNPGFICFVLFFDLFVCLFVQKI